MRAEAFFDTSVLIYVVAEGDPRGEIAERLLATGGGWSVQVLNEFASVCRRKLKMEWDEIVETSAAIRTLCGPPAPLTLEVHDAAVEIARRFTFNFYDALILASALEAKCSVLYSEDMQHGQKVEGLTITNPFAPA